MDVIKVETVATKPEGKVKDDGHVAVHFLSPAGELSAENVPEKGKSVSELNGCEFFGPVWLSGIDCLTWFVLTVVKNGRPMEGSGRCRRQLRLLPGGSGRRWHPCAKRLCRSQLLELLQEGSRWRWHPGARCRCKRLLQLLPGGSRALASRCQTPLLLAAV